VLEKNKCSKKECVPGTDVMILKIFSPNFSAKKLAFLIENKDKLCKILIITLFFEKNAILCRNLSKIAENCDHNIDPWKCDEEKKLQKS
jgi:hypothetical protein